MSQPDEPGRSDVAPPAPGPSPEEEIIRQFVEHWGMMARSWGINPTMGELFALLYISGSDWTADALRHRLKVSRGNVSMNLRELIAWGVVHKVHRQGERREFFRAETDIWTLFRRILTERKRRELDPTLALLDRACTQIAGDPELAGRYLDRVGSLRRFFALINALAARVDAMAPSELEELAALLGPPEPGTDGTGSGEGGRTEG
ncbi:GbsR/MarR family transcriptional regulator [Tautonia sociabilis]|uniref:GbsR/MarR family transcriptional regulator n=1 Tax=Tautonia sociabilis TaxID=2080755 RepID=UPI0018F3BFF8|nr:transcriptional regulator [Tautonia sociabilis]